MLKRHGVEDFAEGWSSNGGSAFEQCSLRSVKRIAGESAVVHVDDARSAANERSQAQHGREISGNR